MSVLTDSDGDDLTDYTASIRTYDTLDELLTRFTLEFKPEYVIKMRNRMGPLIVGADAVHLPEHKENLAAILIKPVNKNQWWRRLRIDTTGSVTLRSRKLRWWLFTLDLEGCYNPLQGTTDASFRVATKWDLSRGEYKNKKRLALGDATEGRLHWNINYNLPEVAGSFGSSRRSTMHDVHAEVGYAHAEVSKIELVVWPWRNNPRWQYEDDFTRVNNPQWQYEDDFTRVFDDHSTKSPITHSSNNSSNSNSSNTPTMMSQYPQLDSTSSQSVPSHKNTLKARSKVNDNTSSTGNALSRGSNTTYYKGNTEYIQELQRTAQERMNHGSSMLCALQSHIAELKDGLISRIEEYRGK